MAQGKAWNNFQPYNTTMSGLQTFRLAQEDLLSMCRFRYHNERTYSKMIYCVLSVLITLIINYSTKDLLANTSLHSLCRL